MLSWLGKKRSTLCQTVSLPGDVGVVGLPAGMENRLDGSDTLLAWPARHSDIFLRFSSVSFDANSGSDDRAARFVRKRALEHGWRYRNSPGKVIATYESKAREEGKTVNVRYWEVGQRATVVIFSVTVTANRMRARHVRDLLSAAEAIADSIDIRKYFESVPLAGGDHAATSVETLDPVPQQFRRFAAAEEDWLEASRNTAVRLAFRYAQAAPLDPATLDAVFAAWHEDDVIKRLPPEQLVDALGAAFGDYLVAHEQFDWGVLSDEFGSELVVRHAIGSTTAFPRSSVQKRIDNFEPSVFQQLHAVIRHQLNELDPQGNAETDRHRH
ncbi:MAG: DUF3806 domain-containing protein [Pseudomonadota bacterium]